MSEIHQYHLWEWLDLEGQQNTGLLSVPLLIPFSVSADEFLKRDQMEEPLDTI